MKSLIALFLAAGIGGGGYWLWKNGGGSPMAPVAKVHANTAVVESRDIEFAVNAAGDIGPADQVSVRSEINGKIVELPVDIGDKVAKGSLLCRLDDKDLQIERSQRLTEIDGARLQLQRAGRNFERSRHLFADQLISQEVFDDMRTEYHLSTNALDRSEKALRLVEDRLAKAQIMAPFDCTVLTRPVSLGQTVSGAAGFNSGTDIMTIANLNDMVIHAHVNQADVVRLSTGQAVDIQVESVPGLIMKGVMERIAPQAVVKNGIKGFSARVSIQTIDPRVRPGMTAILTIPVASAEGVLSVPLAAVFTEPTGARYVFVQHENEFQQRPVSIGVSDYSFAEVTSGLQAGEVVALDQIVTTLTTPGASAKPSNSVPSKATKPTQTTGTSGSVNRPASPQTTSRLSRSAGS